MIFPRPRVAGVFFCTNGQTSCRSLRRALSATWHTGRAGAGCCAWQQDFGASCPLPTVLWPCSSATFHTVPWLPTHQPKAAHAWHECRVAMDGGGTASPRHGQSRTAAPTPRSPRTPVPALAHVHQVADECLMRSPVTAHQRCRRTVVRRLVDRPAHIFRPAPTGSPAPLRRADGGSSDRIRGKFPLMTPFFH